MAQNIFEQYGLKEVANVTFYDSETKVPVLYLDTLKVSTIEQTADNVDAKGGIGNPTLITWDYNKAVNVTLEDALMSPASLNLITGAALSKDTDKVVINMTEEVTTDAIGKAALNNAPLETKVYGITRDGEKVEGTVAEKEVTFAGISEISTLRIFYSYESAVGKALEITIDAGTFPGTYKVVGDTVVRSAKTGKDEPFQFVIEKAKVSSNVTFTMQAEGDPATFSMSLRVLKDDNGNMFKLVKYTA